MLYKTQTALLIKSYENSVAWGNADHEESLHNAINGAFPHLPDEAKAELFVQIEEQWESYRESLAPRKLWIGNIVNNFMSARIAKTNTGLKVSK